MTLRPPRHELRHSFGDPRVRPQIWEKVVIDDNGCWIWTGYRVPSGYGRVRPGVPSEQRTIGVHRYVYEHLVGPTPEGLVLDHLCRVRNCCNPDHLEAVTQRINVLRSDSPTAVNAAKTHCPSGHPYSGENLRRDTRGRKCRTCQRRHHQRPRIRKPCPHCGRVIGSNNLAAHIKCCTKQVKP